MFITIIIIIITILGGNSVSSPVQNIEKNYPKPVYQDCEPHSSGNCSSRMNVDFQMAAFRDQNLKSKNRLKQLECLKRMEEKYKNSFKEDDNKKKTNGKNNGSKDPNPGPPGGSLNSNNKINMYVMDISEVLTEKACVSWRPQKSNPNAPGENMLHSLVLGRGELIMFGGVQNNPIIAFPVSSHKCVTNSTHIITAPHNII